MAFNGNWDQIVLKALASLVSESVSTHSPVDSDSVCVLLFVVGPFFPVFCCIQNHKANTMEPPLEIKCLPVSFFFFFPLPRKGHSSLHPSPFVSLFHVLSLRRQWPFRAFLRMSLSQDTPYSENPRWVSSSSPGQKLAMTPSLPCKSSLNGMRLKLSSSWNYKVSPVSQPIMTPSKAIAGPLMYFGPCPLLYLAKLWESTV